MPMGPGRFVTHVNNEWKTCAPLLQKIYYRRSSSSHVDSVGILSSTSRASKTRFTNGISVADNFVPNSDFEPLTSWGLLQKEPGIIPNGKGISQSGSFPLWSLQPLLVHSLPFRQLRQLLSLPGLEISNA